LFQVKNLIALSGKKSAACLSLCGWVWLFFLDAKAFQPIPRRGKTKATARASLIRIFLLFRNKVSILAFPEIFQKYLSEENISELSLPGLLIPCFTLTPGFTLFVTAEAFPEIEALKLRPDREINS
jgi:hypothetical protein